MEASQVARLVELLSQKSDLTGPEYMLYVRCCEAMEVILYRLTRNLQKENNESDSPPE